MSTYNIEIVSGHAAWGEAKEWLSKEVHGMLQDQELASSIVERAIASASCVLGAELFAHVKPGACPNTSSLWYPVMSIKRHEGEEEVIAKRLRTIRNVYMRYALYSAMRDCDATLDLVPENFPGVFTAKERRKHKHLVQEVANCIASEISGIPSKGLRIADLRNKIKASIIDKRLEYDFSITPEWLEQHDWKEYIKATTKRYTEHVRELLDTCYLEGNHGSMSLVWYNKLANIATQAAQARLQMMIVSDFVMRNVL